MKRCERCIHSKFGCSFVGQAVSSRSKGKAKASPEDEDDDEPIHAPPVTPKSAGVISIFKNAIKRKIGDRSPESANPPGVLTTTPRPTIKVPPVKRPAVSPVSIPHLASDQFPSASLQTSRFETNPDPAPVSSIGNVIMGPPPSRTPSIMSSELSLRSSASDFYVQELQRQLRASQEDLAEAHNVIDQQESLLQA